MGENSIEFNPTLDSFSSSVKLRDANMGGCLAGLNVTFSDGEGSPMPSSIGFCGVNLTGLKLKVSSNSES
jgi:hypothetical protein